jgi:hypothetical protein
MRYPELLPRRLSFVFIRTTEQIGIDAMRDNFDLLWPQPKPTNPLLDHRDGVMTAKESDRLEAEYPGSFELLSPQ